MLISMVMLPLFVFSTFLGKFGPKIQNVLFRVKFGACNGTRGAWGWLWFWGGVAGWWGGLFDFCFLGAFVWCWGAGARGAGLSLDGV